MEEGKKDQSLTTALNRANHLCFCICVEGKKFM